MKKIYFNYFLDELKFKLDIEQIICETSTLMHFNKTHFNFLISHLSHQIVLVCPCLFIKHACVTAMSVGGKLSCHLKI